MGGKKSSSKYSPSMNKFPKPRLDKLWFAQEWMGSVAQENVLKSGLKQSYICIWETVIKPYQTDHEYVNFSATLEHKFHQFD